MLSVLPESLRKPIAQLLRFGIVGVAATIVHMSVAFALHYLLNLSPLLSNFFAFLVAWCVSYAGQFSWTFKNSSAGHKQSAPKFFAVSVLSLILNQIIIWVTAEYFQIPFYLAVIFVVTSVPLVTFFLSKYWVFREP